MNTLMKKNSSNGNMPATTFSGMIDKLFQSNVNRYLDDNFWGFNGLEQKVSVPVNLRETNKSFELEVVAPGHAKEDFKINVNGDTLSVSLEHKEEKNQQNTDEGWLRKEYRKQSFSRSFSIDDTIDTSKISAKYNDGILHLSLPKKEGTQPLTRNISIE
jgi:HSP20 family protein